MTTIEAVLFDLDDTLFDYHEYAEAGLRSAADRLEALTGDRFHEALLSMYFEEGITDATFDRFLQRHELSPDLADDLVEAYHAAADPLAPYDETVPVLSERGDDYRLGLVTDGRGGHAKLRRLGIGSFFDAVLVTPTIDASKRDPEVFDVVLSELEVSPEQAVYVGDDPRFDLRIPNVLGMTTIRMRRGRYVELEPETEAAVPDHEIDRLEDLLRCLRKITKAV